MEDQIRTLFEEKECLAPMGSLPFRLLARNYGADTVWGEEIIDRKIINSSRVRNDILDTTDFICGRNLIVRTCTSEKNCFVFQLGTSSSNLALLASEVVAKDVAAIDINMGCPKKFSIQGGMGAVLLKSPDIAYDIIKVLRRSLSIPVTAKIRLLEDKTNTLNFVRSLESAGVSAITVHARYSDTSPKDPALWDELSDIVQVPVIANGDIYTRDDIIKVREKTGCSSVMMARPALLNCSIFRKNKDGRIAQKEIIREYIGYCIRYQEHYKNAKYVCMEMMTMRRHPIHLQQSLRVDLTDAPTMVEVSQARSLDDLANLWNVKYSGNVMQNILPNESDRRYDDQYILSMESNANESERNSEFFPTKRRRDY